MQHQGWRRLPGAVRLYACEKGKAQQAQEVGEKVFEEVKLTHF
jgi:hypothetical protein